MSRIFHPFFRELITNPSGVGAACPSSPGLAKCMASFVPLRQASYVLEMGAGTGAVTQALLQRGIPPQQLIALERSPSMAVHLQEVFKGLRVVQGDATEFRQLLHHHLGERQPTVSAIVSSLPFRSLPRPVVRAIVEEIHELMSPETLFIQFTYDLRPIPYAPFHRFERVASKIIWLNLPPARVDVFQRN
jgi:phosphatidylethanolamine/phosphatidyl-N-methylethanolamine N-methyltransferase